MPIDPVKIPQNVYIEDRIIGPITLRQIMIVMISTGISYAIWAAMKASGPISGAQTTIAWIPAGIGVIFSFVKINGISLLKIVFLSIEKLDKPSRRIWMPRQGIYINIVTKPKEKSSNPDIEKKTQQKGETQIEELSKLLDQGPHEEELSEDTGIKKPVNRDRIKADKRGKPVDDIVPPQKNTDAFSGGLMRDITPPPSHA